MQSFPLKITYHLEQSNADSYCQSDIVSHFKTAVVPTGSITLQCVLSAGKQRFLVVYQALISPPLHKSLGTKPAYEATWKVRGHEYYIDSKMLNIEFNLYTHDQY